MPLQRHPSTSQHQGVKSLSTKLESLAGLIQDLHIVAQELKGEISQINQSLEQVTKTTSDLSSAHSLTVERVEVLES